MTAHMDAEDLALSIEHDLGLSTSEGFMLTDIMHQALSSTGRYDASVEIDSLPLLDWDSRERQMMIIEHLVEDGIVSMDDDTVRVIAVTSDGCRV